MKKHPLRVFRLVTGISYMYSGVSMDATYRSGKEITIERMLFITVGPSITYLSNAMVDTLCNNITQAANKVPPSRLY